MSFGLKMPKSVMRYPKVGITELKVSLSKGQGHRGFTQGIMTAVGYHRATPVSGCVCRKLVMSSLWVVCSSFMSPLEQVTARSANGQWRGWERVWRTSYQNAPSVTASAYWQQEEIGNIHEVWGLHRHPAPVSAAGGIKWKQDILVDDINTQQKSCDGNKGYDFSTPMVLSSPLLLKVVLFISLLQYLQPPSWK